MIREIISRRFNAFGHKPWEENPYTAIILEVIDEEIPKNLLSNVFDSRFIYLGESVSYSNKYNILSQLKDSIPNLVSYTLKIKTDKMLCFRLDCLIKGIPYIIEACKQYISSELKELNSIYWDLGENVYIVQNSILSEKDILQYLIKNNPEYKKELEAISYVESSIKNYCCK